ncbi:MAG: TRL domain-containing protein [Gammaproteobacteria bacterium]
MKKLILGGSIIAASLLTGCASVAPVGGILTDVSLPITATSNAMGSKTGEATCMSILALVAQGDCSIETAKRNGGIHKVTHVDWKANNILGIIGNYKLIVYGD